jgi:hypothetical protein
MASTAGLYGDDRIFKDFHLQPGGYLSKSSHAAANYKSRETKAGDQSEKIAITLTDGRMKSFLVAI